MCVICHVCMSYVTYVCHSLPHAPMNAQEHVLYMSVYIKSRVYVMCVCVSQHVTPTYESARGRIIFLCAYIGSSLLNDPVTDEYMGSTYENNVCETIRM
jgi:hypothetical protein